MNGSTALLWAGTADSVVDLGALLPSLSTGAFSIDDTGNVFGIGFDRAHNIHAIEWVTVPEPASSMALGLLAPLFMIRRRR